MIFQRCRLMLGVCLFITLFTASVHAAEKKPLSTTPTAKREFRAGAATSNITPMLGTPIVGNFTEPLAERIHDELHARCLVLDDGKTRLAFVICDNVGISREVYDEAKRLTQEATGIP